MNWRILSSKTCDQETGLSVVLVGHPKLRNDLRRPTMEEIGYRTDIFTLDGITGNQREYIQWLIKTSIGKGKTESMVTPVFATLILVISWLA